MPNCGVLFLCTGMQYSRTLMSLCVHPSQITAAVVRVPHVSTFLSYFKWKQPGVFAPYLIYTNKQILTSDLDALKGLFQLKSFYLFCWGACFRALWVVVRREPMTAVLQCCWAVLSAAGRSGAAFCPSSSLLLSGIKKQNQLKINLASYWFWSARLFLRCLFSWSRSQCSWRNAYAGCWAAVGRVG